MKHLASDKNPDTLREWSHRNNDCLEPVAAIPEAGQLLLSSLSVLTAAQVAAAARAGLELVTCDGLDMRRSTAVGDLHATVFRVCASAVAEWGSADPAAPADSGELERLRASNAQFLAQIMEMQAAMTAAKDLPPDESPDDMPGAPAIQAASQDDAASISVPESGGASGASGSESEPVAPVRRRRRAAPPIAPVP